MGRRRRLLCALAAVLCMGLVTAAAAYAGWSSQATATQTISTRTLTAPTGLTATAVGHDVQLGWSAGSGGSGYSIQAAANGTSSSCTGASFAALSTTAGTSATDTGRYTPQGSWECYQVETTYGTWSSISSNPVAAVQVGFVATSGTVLNGGTANVIDTGDRLTVAFNQAVKTTTGPTSTNTVCITSGASATFVLGSTTTSGACSASEATKLGTITGMGVSASGRWSATYVWSNANTTLTVTLGSRIQGAQTPAVTSASSVVFDPTNVAANLQSNSGSFHICDTNTAGSDCLADVTGSI
jgi:hypothetical protein